MPADTQGQAEAAERAQRLAELKAARESGLLVQNRQDGGTASAGPGAPSPSLAVPDTPVTKVALDSVNDPNAQGRKEAFVAALDPSGDVNPHALAPAPSPYTLSPDIGTASGRERVWKYG